MNSYILLLKKSLNFLRYVLNIQVINFAIYKIPTFQKGIVKDGLISENFSILQKMCQFRILSISPYFGRWSQSQKVSEIKPSLIKRNCETIVFFSLRSLTKIKMLYILETYFMFMNKALEDNIIC